MFHEFFTVAFLTTFLAAAVRMATPILFAALGETISEKSGILNIGLEAVMLSGAFCSFAGTFLTGSLLIGALCAMLGGIITSLLHGYYAVKLRCDQTVTGVALNLLMLGITSFAFKILVESGSKFPQIKTFDKIQLPLISKIPIIGEGLFHQDILTYISYFLVIVLFIIMRKTTWGIALEAVGQHPKAADTVGISVYKTRYMASILNGALAGIGGGYLTLVQLGVFSENVTAGRGYIALAVVIFGRRNPIAVFFAALIFGGADALQFRMQEMGIGLPPQIMIMLPYVITVIALIISRNKNSDPKALGKAYIMGQR